MRKLELKNVIPPNIVPKSTVDRILTVNGMMSLKLEHICADVKCHFIHSQIFLTISDLHNNVSFINCID